MTDLPARPDLGQLRQQAKDLLSGARDGDQAAISQLQGVSARVTLAGAQLALARHYGFASWPHLKREVERREALDDVDVGRLRALLAKDQTLATRLLEHWCDQPAGASPLGYLAMLRFDTSRQVWRTVVGTGVVAKALIEAGAPVDGDPGEPETPLITAASYGDAEVAQVLVDAGATLGARSSPDSGGVPGGTALLHAAVFGMTDVVDVLVAAGAEVHGIEEAAAAGDVTGWIDAAPADARIRALVMAASHERLDVIDQLVAAGTPIDAVDEAFGGHPLRAAAEGGRPASVARLLKLGADPNLSDDRGRTALDLCRHGRAGTTITAPYDEIEAILTPLTGAPKQPTRTKRSKSTPVTKSKGPVLTVEIVGVDLPGRQCGPGPNGEPYNDIHVGLAYRTDTIELIPGDATTAHWTFQVTVARDDAGSIDVRGPLVHGARGDRHFGLRWVTISDDDELTVFRGAKLRLQQVDLDLLEQAVREQRPLVATLDMTDQHGHPVCATVKPPHITWTLGPHDHHPQPHPS